MINKKLFALIIFLIVTNIINSQSNPAIATKSNTLSVCNELKKENESLKKLLNLNTPISEITSDDIEFKIVKVIGDKRTQMITITTIATNRIENRSIDINMQAMKIVSLEGDVITCNSFNVAGDKHYANAFLNTDIPIKNTFTFGPILPTNEYIKLFNFPYLVLKNNEIFMFGNPYPSGNNEFKDLKIEWK